MITLLLANWRLVAIALLAVAVGVQTWRLGLAQDDVVRVQALFDAFKAQVAAEGEKARADAILREKADQQRKDTADAEHQRNIAALQRDISRMRRERDSARGSIVPPAPAGSTRTDLACFDRTALESAFRGFVAEVRGLVDEGAKATVELDTARRWAQAR